MNESHFSTTRQNNGQASASSNITAVIFDYGLVLARSPTKQEFERMAAHFDATFDVFYRLWETSRNLYDRGDVSAEEYWLKLATQTNRSLDSSQIDELRKIEVEIWAHPDPEMLGWVEQLHDAGIKLALLSNMPLDLAAYVRSNFRWLDKFTFKTFSAEVRLIKPDPAIYEHTLRGLGVSANEALFIDDREPNIRAASALGMSGIQFSSILQMKAELETLNFSPLPRTVHSNTTSSGSERTKQHSGPEIKFQL